VVCALELDGESATIGAGFGKHSEIVLERPADANSLMSGDLGGGNVYGFAEVLGGDVRDEVAGGFDVDGGIFGGAGLGLVRGDIT
jgi:hypothetical protein